MTDIDRSIINDYETTIDLLRSENERLRIALATGEQ